MAQEAFKHSYKVNHSASMGLTVYNCGLQKCEPGHSWGPAVRDHYLIHYILSGRGHYEVGDKQYELSAGSGFLAAPSTVIYYQADQDDPWQYTWVGFNGAEADHLMRLVGLSMEHPIFYAELDGPIPSLIASILEVTGHRPSDEIRMEGKLLEFLAALVELNGHNDCHHEVGASRRYVEKALQYIQYNYSRAINVGDIAESVGISRSHLYRLFMEELNISPNEYLTRFRIDQACDLLEQGLSVSEAAYSSGFSDQLYFSRVFKKRENVPPSKYAPHK